MSQMYAKVIPSQSSSWISPSFSEVEWLKQSYLDEDVVLVSFKSHHKIPQLAVGSNLPLKAEELVLIGVVGGLYEFGKCGGREVRRTRGHGKQPAMDGLKSTVSSDDLS